MFIATGLEFSEQLALRWLSLFCEGIVDDLVEGRLWGLDTERFHAEATGCT